jgi:hypothetical protein
MTKKRVRVMCTLFGVLLSLLPERRVSTSYILPVSISSSFANVFTPACDLYLIDMSVFFVGGGCF